MAVPDTGYYDRPFSMVESTMAQLFARSETTTAAAMGIAEQLANVHFDGMAPAAPDVTVPFIPTPEVTIPAAPSAELFDPISPMEMPAATDGSELTPAVDDIGPVPEYTGNHYNVTLPAQPAAIDLSGKPSRPDLGTEVALPSEPGYATPVMQALTPIDVPGFDFSTLPAFDGVRPEFTAAAPSTSLGWTPSEYASSVLTAVRGKVVDMLAGGTGLPPAIETALFDRARGREDATALKRVQEAFDTWAGRGWSMPPGMLVDAVDVAGQQNQLAANDLSRDILAKSAQWEIDNLRIAVQNGIALESALMQIFRDMTGFALDAAKAQQAAELRLYDVAVALFNARQSAYQTDAAVFRERVQAAVTVIRSRLEAAQLTGQLNEQKLRQYTAEWEGVRQEVEVYVQKMRGAELRQQFQRNKLAAWSEDIHAWVEGINGQKAAWDGYESAVRGQVAIGTLGEVEARIFAETVRAFDAGTNVKLKKTDARLQALASATQRYTALVAAQRERLQADVSVVGAKANTLQADTQRYTAESAALVNVEELKVRATEAGGRNALAAKEVLVKEYDIAVQRLLSQAKLLQESIQAAGHIAGQLAAGATSAMHVSAGMSGSAGVHSGESLSNSQSYSESHNYDHTAV